VGTPRAGQLPLLHDQKRDPIYVAAAGVVTTSGWPPLGLVFRALVAFDPGLMIEAMMHGAGPTADTPPGWDGTLS